jgi:hypothetical protein
MSRRSRRATIQRVGDLDRFEEQAAKDRGFLRSTYLSGVGSMEVNASRVVVT